MRIASGRTDAKLSFVAVDATDLKTRETGLTGFTVYRSRNGGAATAYTTPTVSELSSANMPGVYVLTIDEDTTITSGVDEEEYVVHITCAGMAPVTRAVELFRPKATEGNTLDVSAGGEAGLDWANIGSPTSTVNLSGTTVKTATDVETDTANIQTRIPAALVSGRMDASVGAYQSGLTPLQPTVAGRTLDVSAGGEAGLDWANIGSPTTVVGLSGTTVKTATDVETDTADIQSRLPAALVSGRIDASVGAMAAGVVTAAAVATGAIDADALSADAAAEIADAVWDEGVADHLGAGSTGAALNAAGSAGDPWSTPLPGAYGAGTAGKIIGDNLNATVGSRASQTSVDTVDDFLDTEIAAIKAKTDTIPASPAATGDIPTAAAIADAVWDEATSGHATAGTTCKALTDIATDAAAIEVDTQDIQSRLPAALTVGGNIKADALAIDGSTTAADKLQRSAETIATGTVSGSPTTTSIPTTGLSPAASVADQFVGRVLIFAPDTTTAALRGQATDITASSSGGTLTVTALTSAPASGDTFTIV